MRTVAVAAVAVAMAVHITVAVARHAVMAAAVNKNVAAAHFPGRSQALAIRAAQTAVGPWPGVILAGR